MAKAKAKKTTTKKPAKPTFADVRDEAVRQFERHDDGTSTDAIYKLARFGDAARETLVGGFDQLIERKVKHDKLINSVAFNALAFAVLDLPPHPDIGKALHRAFRVAAELEGFSVHYNLNQTCGPLAVALVTVDHRAAIPDLEQFRERFDHYEHVPFHTMVLYAQWLFANDGEGPRRYIAESEQLKCLGVAAAALADLDYKPGRATLETRMKGKLEASSREAMIEATSRLRTQRKRPAPRDRMIFMFGRVSPVEIALGYETENVFRERAVAKRAARV